MSDEDIKGYLDNQHDLLQDLHGEVKKHGKCLEENSKMTRTMYARLVGDEELKSEGLIDEVSRNTKFRQKTQAGFWVITVTGGALVALKDWFLKIWNNFVNWFLH